MSERLHGQETEVYQSNRFEKALGKLPEQLQQRGEDEIDRILDNPELGEQKKGDLSYLRVHKFKLNNQLTLLGYSWVDNKIELYLLNLESHEIK
ncbi:type II toxin-antitoxin system RelE/ParE family toxin [Budvicia diplopodorum]|uniref:type II toxin-antitoxin system RelE/ParE family toxin n=1 Tax=Budvicia diplopodorum TaxID=1119056 RepID=UPI00135854F6|nr:type II toxin-antitoxin system RelE/ParE family toxin [Budvicia diplopodorum]